MDWNNFLQMQAKLRRAVASWNSNFKMVLVLTDSAINGSCTEHSAVFMMCLSSYGSSCYWKAPGNWSWAKVSTCLHASVKPSFPWWSKTTYSLFPPWDFATTQQSWCPQTASSARLSYMQISGEKGMAWLSSRPIGWYQTCNPELQTLACNPLQPAKA